MSYADHSHLDLCDFLHVHPCCGAELGDCRCAEDLEIEAAILAHPVGCLCHVDPDQERSDAPARVRIPSPWRARDRWWEGSGSLIGTGVL